jgi:Ras-related protein Rab-21
MVNLSLWAMIHCMFFAALSSLGPIYYRDSHGAVLVYDITDRNSFVRVQNWVKELRKMLGKEIVLAIAGNKIDLEKQRSVTLDEAEAYAKDVGAVHYSTSAKLNKGINEMFTSLSQRMFDSAQSDKSNEETVLVPRSGGRKGPIVIDESSSSAPSSSSGTCCN